MTTTFVLVHGAHHGAWSWDLLVPLLERDGSIPIAITLTGLGERAHELAPDVDLRTHVADVVRLLETRALRDVVLVAHSYGTMVAAEAASRCSHRIRHVVLVDGPVPVDGESAMQLLPTGAGLLQRAILVDGVAVTPAPPVDALGIRDPVRGSWVQTRLTAQPLRCALTPVSLRAPWHALQKTYVQCTRGPHERDYLSRVTPANGFDLVLLEAGHDAMVDAPEELADVLAQVVRADGSRPDGERFARED